MTATLNDDYVDIEIVTVPLERGGTVSISTDLHEDAAGVPAYYVSFTNPIGNEVDLLLSPEAIKALFHLYLMTVSEDYDDIASDEIGTEE